MFKGNCDFKYLQWEIMKKLEIIIMVLYTISVMVLSVFVALHTPIGY